MSLPRGRENVLPKECPLFLIYFGRATYILFTYLLFSLTIKAARFMTSVEPPNVRVLASYTQPQVISESWRKAVAIDQRNCYSFPMRDHGLNVNTKHYSSSTYSHITIIILTSLPMSHSHHFHNITTGFTFALIPVLFNNSIEPPNPPGRAAGRTIGEH